MTPKSSWREVRRLGRDTYTDAFWALLYALAGGLAPLWIAWSYKAVRTAALPNITEFALAGEFALYAAAIIAPAAFLLAYDRKKSAFPGRVGMILLCGILGLASVFAYMMVAPHVLAGEPIQLASTRLYSWLTIALFVVATAFSFTTAILDATRPPLDVRKIDDQQVDDLTRRTSGLPS